MQTIKPASNQLFCEEQEAITKTSSGFLLSEKSAEKPKVADVINVGDGVTGFSRGDVIVYKPYATVEIKLNGKDYFLINQEDVLGTVLDVKDEA